MTLSENSDAPARKVKQEGFVIVNARTRWFLLGCILLVVILVGGWFTYLQPLLTRNGVPVHQITSTSDAENPIDKGTDLHGVLAPDFTLQDQYGKTVSLSQFKGKVVVLAFVDSECTTMCPLMTSGMMDAVKMLGPDAAKHIQLLGIDANPEAISVSNVKQYSVDHDMMNSWHFLTGSLSQLKSVWHDYSIYTAIVNNQIDHTPALYIIDPQGREQVLFMTPSQYASVSPESSVVAAQIARFLPSDLHTDVKTVSYQPPQVGPSDMVKLPEVSPTGRTGTVTLGPGHPQIIAFFASWAPDVKADLAALNEYAKQPGSPEVIAVDEAPVEPNDQAVMSTLRGLKNLKVKIGIDQTGEVADAYQATDIMWFSLTDGKGKIIWSQDAWSTKAGLEKAVNSALQKVK